METNIPPKKDSDFVIVHNTDFRPDSVSALAHSVALGKAANARVISLHAVTEEDSDETTTQAEELLNQWSNKLQTVEHHVLTHKESKLASNTLLKQFQKLQPDLLVVGTRQLQEKKSGFRASMSEVLAMDSCTPTLVVHLGEKGLLNDDGHVELHRILLPVGDSEEARDAVRGLTTLLDRLAIKNAEIHLLRVGDDEILEYLRLPDREGWRWQRHTVQKITVAQAVADAAQEQDVDLIVMATRGQDGVIDILNGTHTQKVIRNTSRPLLVVPVQA